MSCHVSLEQARQLTGKYQGGLRLTGEAQGAVAGCCSGVTHCEKKEFGRGDVHNDQEGFLVIRGHGEAKIGGELIDMVPGVAIIVPAGVSHTMRCREDSDCYETFWFHSAVSPDSVPEVKEKCHSSIREKTGKEMASCRLLGEENGCVDGCAAGVTLYTDTEYIHSGSHEDQEGFFVLEGTGFAKVGEEEFPVAPGTAFIAPAHTWHSVRRDEGCRHVAVFWFHSAI